MKKTKKQIISLMVIALLLSCFSVLIYANEGEIETSTVEEYDLIEPLTDSTEPSEEISPVISMENESYPSGYSAASIPDGVYNIMNLGTGKYIDIHGPNTEKIHQWTYHEDLHAVWEITKLQDGYYTIKTPYNNKYLGATTTQTGVDNIYLYSSVLATTKWLILENQAGQHTFVPCNHIGRMLCAPNNSTGTELQLTDVNMTNNYNKWLLIELIEPVGTNLIQNIETRRFASPYGPYLEEGTRIHQWNFSTSSARKWIFEKQTDYFFTIKDQYTQKYMGFAEDEDGYVYIEQFSAIQECTKWRIYLSSSGHYVLTPKGYAPYSYAISVDPSYNNNGSILQLVEYSDNSNRKDEWQLIRDATYLGVLTTEWNSDASSVAFWDLDGTDKSIDVYIEQFNYENIAFYFIPGVREGMEQWEDALDVRFTEVSNENSADLTIYGGTQEQLLDFGEHTSIGWNGLTTNSSTIQGIMNINGGNEIAVIRLVR